MTVQNNYTRIYQLTIHTRQMPIHRELEYIHILWCVVLHVCIIDRACKIVSTMHMHKKSLCNLTLPRENYDYLGTASSTLLFMDIAIECQINSQ